MDMKKLKPVFYICIAVLGLIGTVLYMASYFWGLFFILGAIGTFFVYRGLTGGKDTVEEDAVKFLKNLAIPFIGFAVAIVVGGIIMALTRQNPFEAYAAL